MPHQAYCFQCLPFPLLSIVNVVHLRVITQETLMDILLRLKDGNVVLLECDSYLRISLSQVSKHIKLNKDLFFLCQIMYIVNDTSLYSILQIFITIEKYRKRLA